MSKLGIKILSVFTAVALLAVILLSGTYAYVFMSVQRTLVNDARKVIEESVKSVDGDKLEAVMADRSKDSDEFKEIYDSMIVFKASTTVANIYTLGKLDEKNAYFIVDASPDPAELGEEYVLEDEMKTAFQGQISVTRAPYTDEWGTVVSAYAPIKNNSGQVIAIIGVDQDVAVFQNIKKALFISLIIAMSMFCIFAFIIVFLFSKRLQKHVGNMQKGLNEMGKGNLTYAVTVKSKDEIQIIADSINSFREHISKIINSLKTNSYNISVHSETLSTISEEMASSSENVSAIIQNIASGAAGQVENLNEMSSLVNVFGKQIDDIVDSINDVNMSTHSINDKAVESSDELNKLVSSVDEIKASFDNVAYMIQALGANINRISEITEVINSVATQTSLLALNAAIEAARAGESGRGFAVVADEIRKLAEQTKESSDVISSLVESISGESSRVVDTTANVSLGLENQIKIVQKSTESFKEIIDNINLIIPKIDEIAGLATSVSIGKENIVSNIENISSVAEQFSAASQEIASMSEELNASTEEVASTASSLKEMTSTMSEIASQFQTTELSARDA